MPLGTPEHAESSGALFCLCLIYIRFRLLCKEPLGSPKEKKKGEGRRGEREGEKRNEMFVRLAKGSQREL